MTERTDDAIWNAVTQRLSAVEAYIPSAPVWRPEGEPMARPIVRLVSGTAFGRKTTLVRRTSMAWGLGLLALAVALAGAAILAGLGRHPTPSPLRPTGSMSVYRYLQSATLLADGRVLMIGGTDQNVNFSDATRRTAELYDPNTGVFSTTGSMLKVRVQPVATRLHDGRVLVLGGTNEGGSVPSMDKSAELYDPTAGTFTPTGSMAVARGAPTATRLSDGKVLVLGGNPVGPSALALASAEIYDPASGVFSPTGSMHRSRSHPVATPLLDGRVLVTGGDPSGAIPGPDAEVFDPATGRFTSLALTLPGDIGRQAVLLHDGRVLLLGGTGIETDAAEVFDPVTGTVASVGPMAQPALFFVPTLLPDGRVLITGGQATAPFLVEIFDPATNRFSHVPGLTTPTFSSATVLTTGDVLIAGGFGEPPGDSMNTAFLLDSNIKGEPVP